MNAGAKTRKPILIAVIASAALFLAMLSIHHTALLTACAMTGSGSQTDPYIVSTAADLSSVATGVNSGLYSGKYFKLANDIELSGSWTPIGTDIWYFRGYFDGNGHKITGLYINSSSDYQGLFGNVGNAIIHDLGVEGVSVKGRGEVAGLAGKLNGSTVFNCYATGSVTGEGVTGGLVGLTEGNSHITECYFIGSVTGTGTNCTGGLAGYPSASVIKNCYTAASVSGGNSVGGIAGNALGGQSSLTIENCYAAGTASNGYYVGGIVGAISYSNSSEVKNCAAVNLSAAGFNAGRITGNKSSVFSNNHGLDVMKNNSGDTNWAHKGLTDMDGADLDAADAFKTSFWTSTMHWDANVWDIADNRLPVLKGVGGPQDYALKKASFTVSIIHSPSGMAATILIVREGVVVPRNFGREGYIFMGLYTDAAMTQEYGADAGVTGDMTLYAKWERAHKTPRNISAAARLGIAFLTAASVFGAVALAISIRKRGLKNGGE